MKAIFTSLLLLVLTIWCPQAKAGEPASDKREPPVLVLVPSNTWFHAAPGAKAYRFRVKKRLPSMKRTYLQGPFPLYATARPRRVLLFRWADPQPDIKGWVHIQPVGPDTKIPNGCDFLTPGYGLEVDLFVRSEALLSTLKEPFQGGYEDGTELGLKPGVVIRPLKKKGRYLAETPYLQVELSLPPDSITRTFRPQPGFSFGKAPAWAKGPVKLKVGPDMQAKLFGVEIGLQAEPVRRGHGRWLITDAGSCARVVGVGRYRPLDQEPTSGMGGVVGPMRKGSLKVAEGSPVAWPDGKLAGHTSAFHSFNPKQEVRSKLEAHRCVKHDFFDEKVQVLCFPSDRVTVH